MFYGKNKTYVKMEIGAVLLKRDVHTPVIIVNLRFYENTKINWSILLLLRFIIELSSFQKVKLFNFVK